MPRFLIKTPVKLERAEIIRSDKIIIKDRMAKIPVLEIDEKAVRDMIASNYDEVIGSDLRLFGEMEKDVETKKISKKKFDEKPTFSEYFTIINFDKPVNLSFDKVPEGSMPLSEVQNEVQKAYDKGFDDGQQITISTFKAELETHQQWVRNIDLVVKELQKQYMNETKKMEESLAHLSVMVAEHILEREITANSDIVIEQTRKAIRSLDGDVIFKIHLNPQDIEILKEVKSTLLPDSSALEKVELTANNSVERGSCVLETSVGDVDARLKSQLQKIEGMLKETIRNTESDTYFPAMELEDFDKHDSREQNIK